MVKDDSLRANEKIKAPRVLVIDEKGEKLGVMLTKDAIFLAKEREVDLVEVNPGSDPPVARLMDYGKYLYKKHKQEKEAKKKQIHQQVKEVKLGTQTEEHDLQTKLRHIRRFLEEGHKAKIIIIYRGREMVHPELGKALLERVIEEVKNLGTPEYLPKLDGRNLVTVIAPYSKAQKERMKAQLQAQERQKALEGESD